MYQTWSNYIHDLRMSIDRYSRWKHQKTWVQRACCLVGLHMWLHPESIICLELLTMDPRRNLRLFWVCDPFLP